MKHVTPYADARRVHVFADNLPVAPTPPPKESVLTQAVFTAAMKVWGKDLWRITQRKTNFAKFFTAPAKDEVRNGMSAADRADDSVRDALRYTPSHHYAIEAGNKFRDKMRANRASELAQSNANIAAAEHQKGINEAIQRREVRDLMAKTGWDEATVVRGLAAEADRREYLENRAAKRAADRAAAAPFDPDQPNVRRVTGDGRVTYPYTRVGTVEHANAVAEMVAPKDKQRCQWTQRAPGMWECKTPGCTARGNDKCPQTQATFTVEKPKASGKGDPADDKTITGMDPYYPYPGG